MTIMSHIERRIAEMEAETVFLPAQINPDGVCDASYRAMVQGRVEMKGAPRGKANFIKLQEVARKTVVLQDGTVLAGSFVDKTTPGARNVMNMQVDVKVDGYDSELNRLAGNERPKNFLQQDSRILQYGQTVRRVKVDKNHRKFLKELRFVKRKLSAPVGSGMVAEGVNGGASGNAVTVTRNGGT